MASFAQGGMAKATIDTSSILIGQQVTMKLELKIPAGTYCNWPLLADSLAPSVEITEVSGTDTSYSTDKKMMTLVQRLRITSFDTGVHVVPSIPFYQRTQKGDTMGLLARTSELLLTVATVPVDTTKPIKDIKGLMTAPLTFREMLPWILLGLLAAGGLSALYIYMQRRRKRMPFRILPARPGVPPHVIAFEQLEHLRNAKLWQTGRIKEYHSELTDIIRTYIEGRFGTMAMEMTTDEILKALAWQNLPADAHAQLREMLVLADLVKFAKENPLPTEHDMSMKRATDFVSFTMIRREEPKEPAEQADSAAVTINTDKG